MMSTTKSPASFDVADSKNKMDDDTENDRSSPTQALDVLAHVASVTLHQDGGRCISKRQAGCLETLSFEQLKRISDKSLVALFTEGASNELSKQYWYYCRLLPDECNASFNSFGGDTKAKRNVKSHILDHISELSERPDSSDMQFEPIAVRKRRDIEKSKNRKLIKSRSPKPNIKEEDVDDVLEEIEENVTVHDHSYTIITNSCKTVPDVESTVEIYDTNAPLEGPEVTVDAGPEFQYVASENPGIIQVFVEPNQTTTKQNQRQVYPPMPKYEINRTRAIVDIDDEELESLDDVIEGSEEWIRRMAIRCMRDLRVKKESEFICRICKPEKRFTASATLLYHYRSHAKIKPFVCLICNSAFTRQHSLNYHMLIHNNQSRFTCQECGRKFRHPSHFREHKRRHTGETPFECNDCGSKFKTRNTFKRHLKTRHSKILTPHGILQNCLVNEDDDEETTTITAYMDDDDDDDNNEHQIHVQTVLNN